MKRLILAVVTASAQAFPAPVPATGIICDDLASGAICARRRVIA